MAAPTSKTIKNLNGKWVMNKQLSDSPDEGLALQGIGFLTRKGIGLATVTITVKQYEGAPRPPSTAGGTVVLIDIVQSASGLTSTQEHRCADDVAREHTDWLFGTVEGSSRFYPLADVDVDDAFLKKGWEFLDGEEHVVYRSRATNKSAGWTATQLWGFQTVDGKRRHCRNTVIQKGSERAQFRMVYDFVEE